MSYMFTTYRPWPCWIWTVQTLREELMKQSQWEVSTETKDDQIVVSLMNASASKSHHLKFSRYGDKLILLNPITWGDLV